MTNEATTTNGTAGKGVDKDGTHATHCCDRHGCKYGDKKCPVELGKVKQETPCIDCHEAGPDGGFYDSEMVWQPTIRNLIRKFAKQLGPKGKGSLSKKALAQLHAAAARLAPDLKDE
jgi:hypothetical protein